MLDIHIYVLSILNAHKCTIKSVVSSTPATKQRPPKHLEALHNAMPAATHFGLAADTMLLAPDGAHSHSLPAASSFSS